MSILVAAQWKDTAIIRGKKSSTKDIMDMSRITDNPDSNTVCPPIDNNWDMNAVCKTKYNGVTYVTFEDPTKDPRPMNITMGSVLHQVSQRHTSSIKLTLQQCNMTVGNVTEGTSWLVDWGLTTAIDGMKIVCKRGPVPE
jgi:hypothetical protein